MNIISVYLNAYGNSPRNVTRVIGALPVEITQAALVAILSGEWSGCVDAVADEEFRRSRAGDAPQVQFHLT